MTDIGFLLAVIAIAIVCAHQIYRWCSGPVLAYPNAQEAMSVLEVFGLAAWTVYSIVAGYYQGDEEIGRVAAMCWIFLGMIPFVASLVSTEVGGPRVAAGAGLFILLAAGYRFQRRGWLL